ncbi:MAG: hypothetical protein WB783_20950 [Arenicellales bacterium]
MLEWHILWPSQYEREFVYIEHKRRVVTADRPGEPVWNIGGSVIADRMIDDVVDLLGADMVWACLRSPISEFRWSQFNETNE